MFNEKHVDAILKSVVILNQSLGIWAVMIPIALAVIVLVLLINAYRQPGRQSTRWVLASLAGVYVYSGFTILLGSAAMGGSFAMIGAVALWLVALLLVLDVIVGWTEVRMSQRLDIRIASITLMVSGIVLYPILEMLLGFRWPRMVLFGAECPTTIFLIGLLIGCIPKVNKLLYVLVSLNAMATGFSVATHGAPFDFMYAAAGLTGAVMMLIYAKSIFSGNGTSGSFGGSANAGSTIANTPRRGSR